jgi:hypothetical protein
MEMYKLPYDAQVDWEVTGDIIGDVISDRSAAIFLEEGKPNPSVALIAQWDQETTEYLKETRQLPYGDEVKLAEIKKRYLAIPRIEIKVS